jgi:hypothetical protein
VSSVSKGKRLRIIVISDGKPGHENQSLGIAERLPDPDILIMRHHLKESFVEVWNRMRSGLFLGITPAGARIFLSRIYTDQEIESLIAHKPRAVIAAGTTSAGPCLLTGYLTKAKTCVCMKPSLVPLSRFDLAVVPAHDNPPDAPNVLQTLAAPNRVSPKRLQEESELWSGELPQGNSPIVSWIIGGPSSSAAFDEEHVYDGLVKTVEWAESAGWKVWLSTARRTPESLEERIAALGKEKPALEWSLLWHRDSRNPLYAMFHRSRVAVVTSDSVSMIAEAASAGCGPVVFQASGSTDKRAKQDRMVDRLMEAGYGERAVSHDDLADALDRIARENRKFKILDDTAKAAERLLKIISPE